MTSGERAEYESRLDELRGYLRTADRDIAEKDAEIARLRRELFRVYNLDPTLVPEDSEDYL